MAACLNTKGYLKIKNKSCFNFEVISKMYEKFSRNMYNSISIDEMNVNNIDDNEETEI